MASTSAKWPLAIVIMAPTDTEGMSSPAPKVGFEANESDTNTKLVTKTSTNAKLFIFDDSCRPAEMTEETPAKDGHLKKAKCFTKLRSRRVQKETAAFFLVWISSSKE